MRVDTRREGLRAAARVAMTITVLGCGGEGRRSADGSVVEVPPPSPPPAGSASAVSPVDLRDCESVVADAFPIPSDYPGKAKVVGAEVVRCCEEMVLKVGNSFPAAWDCCALDEKRGDSRYIRACTPWGPPMPRPMMREARVQEARAEPRTARLDLRGAAATKASRLAGLREGASELSPEVRAAAIATWRARMVAEHGSSRVFAQLAAQLAVAGEADAAVEAAAFAAEEIEHGVSCGAVVEALGGEAIDDALPEATLPLHQDASSPLEAALRNVLSVACLAETVAVALIGAERAAMPAGPLRELLTEIWSDEIGHARFGWRLLDLAGPRLEAAGRQRLEAYLEIALAHLIEHELAHLPADFRAPPGGEAVGLCDGREARGLFAATVDAVLVPALARRGLWGRDVRQAPAS